LRIGITHNYPANATAKAYVLHDGTVQGRSPEGWAKQAVKLWRGWRANYILAEVNQGGDLVTSVLRTIDPGVPVRKVHASKGKVARAEPIAALYEQGRVLHAGRFSELEDELAGLGVPKGAKGQKGSPDRADALVWAVTELLLRSRAMPRIRQL